MRLSNIVEQDPATASGAAAMGRTLGSRASGAAVARALGKAERGEALNPTLLQAIAPYADALDKILSVPAFRNKFTQLVKQVQSVEKKNQEVAAQQQGVNEDQDSVDAVVGAITRRIMSQHMDVLSKYGPVKVMAAIDDVAQFAGGDGLDEIGSSDVSIWTKQAIQDLEAGHYDRVEEAEEDKVDTVTMDIPLLLRMMEFAREDAQEDMDLHDVAERMIAMSKDGPLSMDDYDSIVGSVEALPAPEEEPVEEGYYAPGPEVMPGAVSPQEDTNVSFNQTKRMGDASVTVSANAKDMEELHRVLKLAGIEVEKSEPSVADAAVALAPHAHAEERPEGDPCPQCGSVDCTCPPGECTCGSEKPVKPLDFRYSTDKTALVNVLRDKLKRL